MIPADVEIVSDFNKFAESHNLKSRLRVITDLNGSDCLVAEAEGGLPNGMGMCVLARNIDTDTLMTLVKALKVLSGAINIR